MTFHQLRIFERVAKLSSYTHAAAELRLTQPAVSAQVRELERAFGLPLFERLGRQIMLTEAGRELESYARRIFDLVEELETVMGDLQDLKRGRVTLATVSTAGAYVVPPLLGAFRAQHPGIVISLEVTNRATVLRRLAQNEVDLAIMGRPPQGIPHVAQPFLADELVAIVAADSPLTRLGRVSVERLAQEPFVMREAGSGTRLAAEEFFDARGMRPQVALELSTPSAVKAAVAAGLGVTVLSRHAITADLALGRVRILDVQGFPLRRQWYMLHRREKRLSRAARAFMDFLRASAELVLATRTGRPTAESLPDDLPARERERGSRASGSRSASRVPRTARPGARRSDAIRPHTGGLAARTSDPTISATARVSSGPLAPAPGRLGESDHRRAGRRRTAVARRAGTSPGDAAGPTGRGVPFA